MNSPVPSHSLAGGSGSRVRRGGGGGEEEFSCPHTPLIHPPF